DCLEQVERAEAVDRQAVPERVVAAGPDDPHVASLDLLRRERRTSAVDEVEIHVVEVVFARSAELIRFDARAHRFVEHRAGFRFIGSAAEHAGREKYCSTDRYRAPRHPCRSLLRVSQVTLLYTR